MDSSCSEEYFYLLFCNFEWMWRVSLMACWQELEFSFGSLFAEVEDFYLAISSLPLSLYSTLSLSLLPVFVIFYYNPNFIRTISPYYISFLFLRCVWSSNASFPWDLWIPVFHSECLELPFQFFSFCAVVLLDWYGLWSKHVIEEKMVKQKDVLES